MMAQKPFSALNVLSQSTLLYCSISASLSTDCKRKKQNFSNIKTACLQSQLNQNSLNCLPDNSDTVKV